MEAVVYTSNTGSTEHYAKLLGHELRVSVYSTEEAGNKLPTGTEIIYLGWIMAGKIQRFGLARKKYKICAVCAVGMGQTGTQRKEIREKKTDRTPEEEDMLDMMLHGGERVKIQNLQGVISWYNGKR